MDSFVDDAFNFWSLDADGKEELEVDKEDFEYTYIVCLHPLEFIPSPLDALDEGGDITPYFIDLIQTAKILRK